MTTKPKSGPGELKIISLEQIHPSAHNPRKTRNTEKDASLAKSIEALGLLVPLKVRPRTEGGFEIVDGGRRYDACGAAKLDKVPCLVGDVTDEEAAAERLTLNSERDEVPPVEEAEAIKRLVERIKGKGALTPAIAEAAARLGKSMAYVADRLELMSLAPKVIEAVREEDLPLTWALEFRRVADHVAQTELLNLILSDSHRAPSSLSDLRKTIETEYSLDLARAPFDRKDAELVPKAGSCEACEKHTHAQAQLFEGLGQKSPDICRDRTCYDGKVKAWTEKRVEAGKAGSAQVLTGNKAEKAIDDARYSGTYAKLDDSSWNNGKQVNHRQLLKTAAAEDPELLKKVVTAVGHDGRAVELYPRETMKKLLDSFSRSQAKAKAKPKTDAEKKAAAKEAKARAEAKTSETAEIEARNMLGHVIHDRLATDKLIKAPVAQLLLENLDGQIEENDTWADLAEAMGMDLKVKRNGQGYDYESIRKVEAAARADHDKALWVVAFAIAHGYDINPDARRRRFAAWGSDYQETLKLAKQAVLERQALEEIVAKVNKQKHADLPQEEAELLYRAGWTLGNGGWLKPPFPKKDAKAKTDAKAKGSSTKASKKKGKR
jgi:ParB/RepB/Spo0J family partition protein